MKLALNSPRSRALRLLAVPALALLLPTLALLLPTLALLLPTLALLLTLPARADALATTCQLDDALSEAAAALLLEGAHVDAASLAHAARAAGSDAPVVHALHVRVGEDARVDVWLTALNARADAPLACGQARDATHVLWLATARGGALAALADDAQRVELRLAPTFHAPRLVVLDAAGAVHDVAVEAGAEWVALSLDLPRPLLVQLVATGPAGPRPVAERSVGRGARPADVALALPSAASLSERLSAARGSVSVASLRSHRLLARAATEHARAMCASGRVAHQLAPHASPDERFAALGIRARFVGEAVGRAADLDAAWAALLASPSHRAALLDPRFTDAGTGSATDDGGRVCVAVALASWPRFVPRR